MLEEFKRIVQELRAKGFKDSDVMGITHVTESNLYNVDSGYGHVVGVTILRRAVANYMEFKRRAKLFMKEEK